MQNTTGRVMPLTWILLNIQSTVDLITKSKILVNIRKVWGEDSIRLHCNSGVNILERVGNLPGYGTFWYEPPGIINILLILRAKKKFWVGIYSKGGGGFRMVIPDRKVRFQLSPNRLYYFDSADRDNSVLLLNTVSEYREGVMRRGYEGDREARQAMHMLGFSSERYFENTLRSNMIINFPVTFDNVKNARLIFGPDITFLRVKSMRRKQASVITDYVEIPREILKRCK